MWNRWLLRPSAPASRAARGFSLIELVIAVAIVGILASIALPAYEAQLRTSARAEAQSFVTDAATRQQQYLIDRRSYATSIAQLGMSPPADVASKYTIAIAVTDGPPPTYVITATAIGAQAYDKCAGASAKVLTLDNAGNKTPAGCW